MAGKRGTHDDSDGASGADRNMPAPTPKKQGDMTSEGRGTHDDGFSQPMDRPSELKGGIDMGGTTEFSAPKGTIVFGDHDTRRSTS